MSLSSIQIEGLNTANTGKLKSNYNKDELCGYITFLRGKVEELQSYQLIAKRVHQLEKTLINSLQYHRRESIEIHGLPETIKDDKLEETCLEILEDIGVEKVSPMSVVGCHRLKNRSKVILRFVNRKHAYKALHNKKKLKDINKQKYGLKDGLYINENLCRPLQFLAWKIRMAYKSKKVKSFNVWRGKLSVTIDDEPIPVYHIQDLIDLGLAEEEDIGKFLS